MSHVVSIDTEIRDIAALEAACAELGLSFQYGQTTYKWYGTHVGDFPLPEGMTPSDLGHCDHAIAVPGAGYEIGVRKHPSKDCFQLIFDFWGQGQPIVARLGEGCERLVQLYGVHKAVKEAQRRGFQASREHREDGSIKVFITKNA